MSTSPETSQTGPGTAPSPLPQVGKKLDLRRYFAGIAGELTEVEERIRRQAREFDPSILGYVEYAIESKGKRIRPALVLLTAQATGGVRKETQAGHHTLAVIVEMIHLATLVHDDIMDGASKRRGQPTANAKWGAELSVLLGDCLFAHALKLCTHYETHEINRQIADASREVCSGEILQTQRRFDLKLTIPEYLKIVSMKTGALFRVSTDLAAYLNGVNEDQRQAARVYGDCLGLAYQIYDDCLDIAATEQTIGKTTGTDLLKGKLTLPLLHVLQQDLGPEKERLAEMILHGNGDDHQQLLRVVLDRGGLAYSVRKIQKYLEEAVRALDVLPPGPSRDHLQGIPTALMDHVGTLAR
ncbi:MAG: polyprenyl synthetase family protein [Verrucomicrobiota bacterium]